jgi:ArsR family transcriptional regulator
MKQTAIFQTLGDEIRLRALLLIAASGELCICELVQALDEPQPKVSRHMANLRDSGLLTARRHAQWVFYGLNTDADDWQQRLIEAVVEGGRDDPLAIEDRQRLAAMKTRPQRCAVA